MGYTDELTLISAEIKKAEKRRKLYKKAIGRSIVCPYNIGIVNQNEPELKGVVLCALYEDLRPGCGAGLAKYLGKSKRIMMVRWPSPDLRVYQCSDTNKRFEINIGSGIEYRLLYEEMERKELVKKQKEGDTSVNVDAELAKRLPLEMRIREISPKFKQLIYTLLQKNAIDWYNTLDINDLKDILSLELTK